MVTCPPNARLQPRRVQTISHAAVGCKPMLGSWSDCPPIANEQVRVRLGRAVGVDPPRCLDRSTIGYCLRRAPRRCTPDADTGTGCVFRENQSTISASEHWKLLASAAGALLPANRVVVRVFRTQTSAPLRLGLGRFASLIGRGSVCLTPGFSRGGTKRFHTPPSAASRS